MKESLFLLSTHSGDGTFGNVLYILVDDVDALFQNFRDRRLDTSNKKESPAH